jgi:hypothetical protein
MYADSHIVYTVELASQHHGVEVDRCEICGSDVCKWATIIVLSRIIHDEIMKRTLLRLSQLPDAAHDDLRWCKLAWLARVRQAKHSYYTLHIRDVVLLRQLHTYSAAVVTQTMHVASVRLCVDGECIPCLLVFKPCDIHDHILYLKLLAHPIYIAYEQHEDVAVFIPDDVTVHENLARAIEHSYGAVMMTKLATLKLTLRVGKQYAKMLRLDKAEHALVKIVHIVDTARARPRRALLVMPCHGRLTVDPPTAIVIEV